MYTVLVEGWCRWLGVEGEDGLLVAPDEQGGREAPGQGVQPAQVERGRHRPQPDHRQRHHHQARRHRELPRHLQQRETSVLKY